MKDSTNIEADYNAPRGWVLTNFDDTCEPISDGGRKIPQSRYLKAGQYPIFDQGEDLIGGYTDDASMLFQGKTPVIAFGDHTRRFKFIDRPFVLGADGVKLIGPTAAWNAKCLWYFLQGLKFEDRGYSRHFQFLRKCLLPLPPLSEQSRIVEALDELLSDVEAGVTTLERVRDNLKLYRTSVLKSAVEGALTAEWRKQQPQVEPASELLKRILADRRRRWEEGQLRKFKEEDQQPPENWKAKYREPVAPEVSKLRPLPDGWCWASLDQLSLLVTSGSRGWKKYYSNEGAIFVRSQDIRTDRLKLDEVAHVAPSKNSEGARTLIRYGDLLVTITGANVAKAAIVDVEIPEGYVSQHIGLIRLVAPQLRNFIHMYAVAPSGGRKHLLAMAYGAGKPGLNLDNLRELPIPLPPISEREVIVETVEDQLSIVDHLGADLKAKLANAQGLRQSILRHAFSGKLVQQDPNDEPASELLSRIAAEREKCTRVAAVGKRLKGTEANQASRTRRRRNPRGTTTKETDNGRIADR